MSRDDEVGRLRNALWGGRSWKGRLLVVLAALIAIGALAGALSGSGDEAASTSAAPSQGEPATSGEAEPAAGPTTSGEGESEQATEQAGPEEEASGEIGETDSGTLTPEEQEWVDETGEVVSHLAESLDVIADVTTDPEGQIKLLQGDDETVIRVGVHIGVLQSCGTIVRQVGPAPSARLRDVRRPLLKACAYYEKSGSALARGIDAWDADLIRRAGEEMNAATAFIERATSALRAAQSS